MRFLCGEIHIRLSKLYSILWKSFPVILGVLLPCRMVSAELSGAASPEQSNYSEDAYIWITSDDEKEPLKKLELYPVELSEMIDSRLSIPMRNGLIGPEEKRTSYPLSDVEAKLERNGSNLENLPPERTSDVSGFETTTHPLLKTESNPSPAILLINERLSDNKIYYGFLSVTIPW